LFDGKPMLGIVSSAGGHLRHLTRYLFELSLKDRFETGDGSFRRHMKGHIFVEDMKPVEFQLAGDHTQCVFARQTRVNSPDVQFVPQFIQANARGGTGYDGKVNGFVGVSWNPLLDIDGLLHNGLPVLVLRIAAFYVRLRT
jgi:hypothetical protein